MKEGKYTWRVALAVINAYNDGKYSHCSTAELNSNFGLSIRNQPKVFKQLIQDGWLEDCTINGFYKRFRVLKPYLCPTFVLDTRLNNPQKNLLLRCLELGINDTLSKKEIVRRLFNSERTDKINTPFNKIELIVGQSVFDILRNVKYITGLVPENAVYTDDGYRGVSECLTIKAKDDLDKVANFLYTKSYSGFKRRANVVEYSLTPDIIRRQLVKQELKDYYTGQIPDDYKQYSIDRIDSSRGYTEDNIAITTNWINVMKGDLSIEKFKEQIKLLYDNLIA